MTILELQWNKLIRSLYYNRRRPLWKGRSFRPASQWWKNVLYTREFFKGGVSYVLGDGKSINLWKNRWCGEVILQYHFPDVFDRAEKKWLKVSECPNCNGWSWEKIFNVYDPIGGLAGSRALELKGLLERFRSGQGSDGVVWRWSAKGVFTVKSGYAVLTDEGLRDSCLKQLWKLHVPTMHILLWIVLKKRLPTADNLQKRGWTANTLCVLCGVIPETVDRLFTECVFTRFVMWKVADDLRIEDLGADVKRLWELWISQERSMSTTSNLARLSIIWWTIWSIRNKVIFQCSITDPLLAVNWVNSLALRWGMVGGERRCDVCLTSGNPPVSL